MAEMYSGSTFGVGVKGVEKGWAAEVDVAGGGVEDVEGEEVEYWR